MREIDRIKALPVAADVMPDVDGLVDYYTARLRTSLPVPPELGGRVPSRLWPHQAEALWHFEAAGGLVANLLPGQGKTLLTYLLPAVSGAARPMLIVPSELSSSEAGKEGKTEREFRALRPYWQSPHITIIKVGQLSRDYDDTIFDTFRPQLIMVDEADMLSNPKAARTRRLMHYLEAHPDGLTCRLVALSGTLLRSSVLDYAHFCNRSLGLMSPVPRKSGMLYAWAKATDPQSLLVDKGAVKLGCLDELEHDPRDPDWPRIVVGQRLRQSLGCMVTTKPYNDKPLKIKVNSGTLDPEAEAVLAEMRATGERPDGEPVAGNNLWQHACELALGYWSQWDPWPPAEWREARREWNAAWTGERDAGHRWHSEWQVKDAALQGDPALSHIADACRRWVKASANFKINTKPVWVARDNPCFRFAKKWLDAEGPEQRHRSLIWVAHVAAAHELGKQLGLPVFGAAQGKEGNPYIEDHEGPAILTIASNMTGRNLQYSWSRNLFLDTPASNTVYEQSMARTHRSGQTSECVTVDLYLCCDEQWRALARAGDLAKYWHQMQDVEPRLRLAEWATD